MTRKIVLSALAGVCLAAGGGCQPRGTSTRRPEPIRRRILPPYVAGTVAEYATLVGGGELPVRGYGVVVGLGKNGSAEVPRHLQESISQYLLKKKLGSWGAGTEGITPSRFLRDLDTAVVLVEGAIPPGAPIGDRFEVFVSSLPQTQTASLDGGILMPIEMRLAVGGSLSGVGKSKVWAMSGGPVFVNPFLDVTKADDVAKFKIGRIIGGGVVNRSRPIMLQLRQGDYARVDLIQRRINQRFPGLRAVAIAKNPSMIEVNIPEDKRKDYEHFLNLILHLPVRAGRGAWEIHARAIAEAIEQPGARHEELALVWEAMGRQVIPVLQTLYASRNSPAAYYAARTGVRLGDQMAGPVVLRFATSANSAQQLDAIRELGNHPKLTQATPTLQRLLDDEEETDLVRVGAYESLLKRGDRTRITRYSVSGQFILDVVRSKRKYVIYATQAEQPKLVLFGKDMPVSRELFYMSIDETLTINAHKGADKLLLYRKIPRTGKMSDEFRIDFLVRTLVRTTGALPELNEAGTPGGLALTYSQILRVLNDLCKRGNIPATFVLQPRADVERMYRGAASTGRPDMPGS